jgi:tripartite-type tricarboxylate transporter receptor subunit TctC
VVVINPRVLPVQSFAELVKYLKANPGKVSYASPGNGTIGHMWGELFKSSTGTSMVHIPYRGAGPAINDVLAGEVPVYFDQVASSLPHVKAGKLKALAVSWSSRLDVLPEVPTYRELGYPANNDPSWFGLVAPAGTPADIALRMQQAVATALKDSSVRERLALQGLYASGTTPAEFAKQIDSEIEKMKKVAAFARIRLD